MSRAQMSLGLARLGLADKWAWLGRAETSTDRLADKWAWLGRAETSTDRAVKFRPVQASGVRWSLLVIHSKWTFSCQLEYVLKSELFNGKWR